MSQLAKSSLTKQEKTSSKKAQKRLNLLEEEIEELNEHIESLQSQIEKVKLAQSKQSLHPSRSLVLELQSDHADSLNVIEAETHCIDEPCLMIISQNSRLQESTKHSVTTCSTSLKPTEEVDNCAVRKATAVATMCLSTVAKNWNLLKD